MLPEIPSDQHRDEFASVETIGFGPSLTSVDLDARGVDDEVSDARIIEIVIQPEAITASLVAGDDLDVFGKTKSFLGSQDLLVQALEVACRDSPYPGLLSEANGKREFPGLPPQLESEVENRRRIRSRIDGRESLSWVSSG